MAMTLSIAAPPACAAKRKPLLSYRVYTVTDTDFRAERVTEHRESDDLLTAGLGLTGLRQLAPPAFADPSAPTAAELRRRAIWSNWRGIADLAVGGGYGEVYGSTATVPGREFSAYATVDGAKQPHRVLVQVPDGFDRKRRCVVIAPSSGSRGVYGAISVAGAWALPKGCAVAYTDKGTGTDYFDIAARTGARADGMLGVAGRDEDLAFAPNVGENARGVAFKHAHSQDNPEAHWGVHVHQAAQYALRALDRAFPDAAPFTFANTRTIAVGISNGGGAVLRAAEVDDGRGDGRWLDAVVAGEPSVLVDGEGARALYDYSTDAALFMPCALLHMSDLPQPPLQAQARAAWTERCATLRSIGLLEGDTAEAQARNAYERMRAGGWTDEALRAGALSVGFDLWRAVGVTYASAYGRYAAGEHPCMFSYATINADAAVGWSELVRRQPDPRKRVIFGHSMGGGVAVELASRKHVGSDYGALILESTFTSLPDIAKSVGFFGWVVSWFATQHFDSVYKIGRIDAPILMMHGTADKTVPFALGQALYAAAPSGTRWVPFEGGSHSGLDREQPDLYRNTVRTVIERMK